MSSLLALHARLVITLSVLFVALTLWGAIAFLLRRDGGRLYFAGLAIGELLLVTEVLIGIALWLSGRRPAQGGLHLVYGGVALLTLPLAYAYARERNDRSRLLIFTVAALFLCGILLRAMQTGR